MKLRAKQRRLSSAESRQIPERPAAECKARAAAVMSDVIEEASILKPVNSGTLCFSAVRTVSFDDKDA